MLLQKGGECVYFGDVGKDSNVLVDYLTRNGAPVPGDANPAEFMLEAIGAGSAKRMGEDDWGVIWRNSPEFTDVKTEIEKLNADALAKPDDTTPDQKKEYSTSFFHQFWTILNRTNVSLWRNPDYQYTRLFSHAAIGLVTSLTFLKLDDSYRSLQYRVFAIFIVTVLPALIIAQIEPQYIMSRQVFNRESSSKMYSSTVFALTQIISELPYSVLCAVVFYLLWYFPIFGTTQDSSRAGYQFAMVLITEIFSVTLGQAVAALAPSIPIAALFNPFLLVIFSLFCGVTIPKPNLNIFWRSWMYELNPFTRLVAGMVTTALHEQPVVCNAKNSEFFNFQAPNGESCGAYAGAFASAAGGYLQDPNATDCNFCPASVGDTFYSALDLNFSNRGRDIGIFVCYIFSNVFIILVAARFLKYAKR